MTKDYVRNQNYFWKRVYSIKPPLDNCAIETDSSVNVDFHQFLGTYHVLFGHLSKA